MSDALPIRRYRCTSCGNLTRFTVTTTRRTTAFHHFTVGGDLTIEDEEVLEDRVESVECRWCGTGGGVVELTASEAAAAASSASSAAAPAAPGRERAG